MPTIYKQHCALCGNYYEGQGRDYCSNTCRAMAQGRPENYERTLFINDIHAPYHDKQAIAVVLAFIECFKPHHIDIPGDVCDFYQVSRFSQQPHRMIEFQDDLNITHEVLTCMRQAAGDDCEITIIAGNHEDRVPESARKNPYLSSLTNYTVPALLRLGELNIAYVESMEIYTRNGFVVEHGAVIRQDSAYTAKAQMEKRGRSGISGHTHRLGSHYKTNMAGDFVWFENGCLCDRNPEYVKAPNWQQGFSVGYFKKDDERFLVEQVCITNGKAVYGGREFS